MLSLPVDDNGIPVANIFKKQSPVPTCHLISPMAHGRFGVSGGVKDQLNKTGNGVPKIVTIHTKDVG